MMPGLFDEQFLLKKLDQKVDPLARLNSIVDWQRFLPIIEKALGRDNASTAGRKPYPTLFMFKILILQSLYNQSDEETERFLLRDLLARRFVGLCGSEFGPDFTTIWRFKEALTRAGVLDALHDAFSNQLDELGFQASKGQIVDASIVPALKPRNSREENEAIRAGNPPLDWSEAKRRQKDVDARWTKKNEQSHFGYKNHIAVDVKHKFIRAWEVTAANPRRVCRFGVSFGGESKTAQGIRLSGAHSAQGAKESSLVGLGEAGQSDAQSHPQPGRACLWGATTTCGHACGALHRFGACEGEDRAEESGLQHGSVGLSCRGLLKGQRGELRPEVGKEANKEGSGAIQPEKGAADQPITHSTRKRGAADRAKN